MTIFLRHRAAITSRPPWSLPACPLHKHLPHSSFLEISFGAWKDALKNDASDHTLFKTCSFFLFVKDTHKYITHNFLEQIGNEPGKCVMGNSSNGRGQMPPAELTWLSKPHYPAPSALLAGTGIWIANISCQFIFISQCLLSASRNTPTALFSSSKDRKWRVPALSLSSFQGHKWRWKPHHSALTTCWLPGAQLSTHKEPPRICHWGSLRKSGSEINTPLKERATLRCDQDVSKATNLWLYIWWETTEKIYCLWNHQIELNISLLLYMNKETSSI